jgi:hypothetical protein
MKLRFPKLSYWLAGIYLAWSLFVFFGTLGSVGHDWWPLWLYFIIWPLSALYDWLSLTCLDWWFPNPKTTPIWVFTFNDYVAGTFYIVVGTIWVWFLGRVFSKILTRLFPFKINKSLNMEIIQHE